jgi:hypothetical protein
VSLGSEERETRTYKLVNIAGTQSVMSVWAEGDAPKPKTRDPIMGITQWTDALATILETTQKM